MIFLWYVGAIIISCSHVSGGIWSYDENNSTWTPPPPVPCNAPNVINGQVSPNMGIPDGAAYTVTCDTGYTISGSGTVTCTSGTLSTAPTCPLNKCDAAALSVTSGSIISGSKSEYNYGDKVKWQCNTDFELVGNTEVMCNGDTWSSTMPTCKAINKKCTTYEVANGMLKNTFPYITGDTVQAVCETTYMVDGINPITCNDDGWSNDKQKCISNDGTYCKSLVAPTNGILSCDATTYKAGTKCTVACNTNYVSLSTLTETTCSSSIVWSHETSTNSLAEFAPCIAVVAPQARKLNSEVKIVSDYCKTNAEKIKVETALTALLKDTLKIPCLVSGKCSIIDYSCTNENSAKIAIKFTLSQTQDLIDTTIISAAKTKISTSVSGDTFTLSITAKRKRATTELKADTTSLITATAVTCQSNEVVDSSTGNCVKCPAGYYQSNSACVACPINTYNAAEGAISCQNCESGKLTYGEGSTSSDQCTSLCTVPTIANGALNYFSGSNVESDTALTLTCNPGYTTTTATWSCSANAGQSCTALPDVVTVTIVHDQCFKKNDELRCWVHCTVTLPSDSTHILRSGDIGVYKVGEAVKVPDGKLNKKGVYSVLVKASEGDYSCSYTDTSNADTITSSTTPVTLTKPGSGVTVTASEPSVSCVLNWGCKISCELSGLKRYHVDKTSFYKKNGQGNYDLVAKQAKTKRKRASLSWEELAQSDFGTYQCDYDGVRSGDIVLTETPMCLKPTVTGGKVKPNEEKIGQGESYTVTCDDDKTLTGSATMGCSAGSLSTAPTCTLTPMCSKPTITGGSVKPRRNKIGDGQSYTVKCGNGNTLTGSATILCTAGSLATAPTCPPTPMCSMPTITGGSVKPRREKIGDGHSYTVKCAKENTLTGSATILCTAGSLSTAPTCTLTPMCSKPTVAGGNVEPKKEEIGEGESYTITCENDKVMAGSATMGCTTGSLSTPPTCTKPALSVSIVGSSTVTCVKSTSCELSCKITLLGLETKKKYAVLKKSDSTAPGGYRNINNRNLDVTSDVMTMTFQKTKDAHAGTYVCEYEFDGKKETSGPITVTVEDL